MTRGELLKMANRFYPDGHLEQYINAEGEFVDTLDGGDSLARFIVSEISEAVDGMTDGSQMLTAAKRAMHTAMGDILSVLAGMDGIVNWRGLEAKD